MIFGFTRMVLNLKFALFRLEAKLIGFQSHAIWYHTFFLWDYKSMPDFEAIYAKKNLSEKATKYGF